MEDKQNFVKPEIETAREMLGVLRRFLNDDFVDESEQQKLWAILSALRGPDDLCEPDARKRHAEKKACVSLIRRAVAGQSFTDHGAYNRFDSEEDAKIRSAMNESHFQKHEKLAFECLGLQWDKVNPR